LKSRKATASNAIQNARARLPRDSKRFWELYVFADFPPLASNNICWRNDKRFKATRFIKNQRNAHLT
jgi:hypothetical protein